MTTLEVSAQTGVTLRQLQHWAEKDLVAPTRADGWRREWSPADIRSVKILADLRSRGVSLQRAKWILRRLRQERSGVAIIATVSKLCTVVPHEKALAWVLTQAGPVVVIEIPEVE